MKIWVGDETGLLKLLNIDQKTISKYRSQDRQRGLTLMSWAGASTSREELIALGLANGSVEIFDTGSISIVRTFQPAPLLCESSTITAETAKSLRIPKHYESKDAPERIALAGLDVVDGSLVSCTKAGVVSFRPMDISAGEAPTLQFSAASQCEKMRLSHASHGRLLCTGGIENDVKIWDVTNPSEPVFKAKNLPHDNTDLRQPVWVSDLSFVPNTEDKLVIAGTAYRQIRLYDTRVKKRPMFNIEIGEYGVNALCTSSDGRIVYVGDKGGYVSSFDIRTGSPFGRYKGCAGSVRSMQCHATLPLIASCGIDRFVRVYNTQTRELVNKFFCKQRMTSLLFSDEEYVEPSREVGGSVALGSKESTSVGGAKPATDLDEDDVESLWSQMEVVGSKTSRSGGDSSSSSKRRASERESQEDGGSAVEQSRAQKKGRRDGKDSDSEDDEANGKGKAPRKSKGKKASK